MKRIILRTDSSNKIGSGHLMRCLALAEALNEEGHKVDFICRDLEGNLIDLINKRGFNCIVLPSLKEEVELDREVPNSCWLETSWKNDLEQTKRAFRTLAPVDWIIVDHYALDYKWEAGVRELTKKIMVIDDLADRKHDCDLLLDQNFFVNFQGRYKELVPKNCKLILGPEFALLRKEFTEVRKSLRQREKEIKRILVFFGGVDPTNETEKAIIAIEKINNRDIFVDVVVGSSNPHKDRIKELCSKKLNTKFYCQVQNMAQIMNEADLAIGGGGTTISERACLGLPSLVMAVAENQKPIVKELDNLGILLSLGWCKDVKVEDLKNSINSIMSNPVKYQSLSRKSAALVDGKGLERIVANLIN